MGLSKNELKKYSKMNFKDFLKEYKNDVNKNHLDEYNKKSWFWKLMFSKENSLVSSKIVEVVASHFFNLGRLQMVCDIRYSSNASTTQNQKNYKEVKK